MRVIEVVLMHREEPVAQSPINAAPGKKPGLRVCWMMLAVAVLSVSAWGASAPAEKKAAAPAKATGVFGRIAKKSTRKPSGEDRS